MDLARVLKVVSRKQLRSIIESEQARTSIWHGAVSSGKTVASLVAFLIAVARAPDAGVIFLIGRTLQTIERNILEPLQQAEGPFGLIARYVDHTRGSNVAYIFGRTIHLVGANNVLAEDRIRGATASLVYIDEATLIPPGVFKMALSRLRVPGARMLATTNPDTPAHWLRKEFLAREGELNLRSWHFVLDDNPWLSEDYKADLKREYVGLWHKRFIDGLWVAAEGAVFDMWDEARHVVDVLPAIRRWIGVGVDYGTSNPFHAVLGGVGVDPQHKRPCFYITAEWRYDGRAQRRQLTDTEYSERLRGWLNNVPVPTTKIRGVRPEYTIVDPSAASFIAQLRRDGLTPVPADNSVLDGIREVSSLLASDRLRVHRSCTGLIEEIPGYVWDEKAVEAGRDEPLKVNDHGVDAKRYLVHTTRRIWRPELQLPVAA